MSFYLWLVLFVLLRVYTFSKFGNVNQICDIVVRIASEYLFINESISLRKFNFYLRDVVYLFPNCFIVRISRLVLWNPKVFLPQFRSKLMYFLNDLVRLLIDHNLGLWGSLNKKTKLRISIPLHTSIINVSWPTDKVPIINNHQFWMQINNLSKGNIIDNSMRPQPEKLNISMRVIYLSLGYNSTKEAILPSANCTVLPVHDNSR